MSYIDVHQWIYVEGIRRTHELKMIDGTISDSDWFLSLLRGSIASVLKPTYIRRLHT